MKINLNHLLNVPMEQWHSHGIKTSAVSANSDGMVNSFLAKIGGKSVYGYRKHEFINGQFTGNESFVIEQR